MTKTRIKKYVEGIGRRKTSVARVRIMSGKGELKVNDKALSAYFYNIPHALQKINSILKKAGFLGKIDISVKVKGGGKDSQLGATIHGLARALVEKDKKLRPTLKKEGFLTRDPRMKERKKYGLKGARRAPQWSKR